MNCLRFAAYVYLASKTKFIFPWVKNVKVYANTLGCKIIFIPLSIFLIDRHIPNIETATYLYLSNCYIRLELIYNSGRLIVMSTKLTCMYMIKTDRI
jgi:hypothetical protein